MTTFILASFLFFLFIFGLFYGMIVVYTSIFNMELVGPNIPLG